MKVIVVLVALWGGGIALEAIGDSINGTSSPFYEGLTIIGYTVGSECDPLVTTGTNTICSTDGSGILAIVGIFGMISIISEFIAVQKY